ncbi:MAG: threonine/serine dehydratase [Pseudomonadota bacterium]
MTTALTPHAVLKAAEQAADRLAAHLNQTSLLEFHVLNDRVGGRIFLKPENLQRMGSFKIRGALNALYGCLTQARKHGVVAWSSGNHAQGVALAAKICGVEAHIVMPHDAPPAKRQSTEALGARVVGYDRYTQDRETIARSLAGSLGAPLIPSYDHPDVIAGQATIGLEISREVEAIGVGLDQALVCCGGGGMTAGIGSVLSERWPTTSLYAVEPEVADDTKQSFMQGRRVEIPATTRSVCDALLTTQPGELTFPINQKTLTDVLTVSDEQALYAVGFAFRELKLVLEPGGAVALAAVLHGKVDTDNKATVAVLSGGNIDSDMLARACEVYAGS